MPLDHAAILAELEQTWPRTAGAVPDGVFLVARCREPRLALGAPGAQIFIPDTHLVPPADAAAFPDVTMPETEVLEFERLVGALERMKLADSTLVVWHLGDLFDLWRTGPGGATVDVRMRLIGQSPRGALHARIQALCDPLHPGDRRTILAGNHDNDLKDFPATRYRRQGWLAPNPVPGTGEGLVIHGDQLDPIEALPQWVKELVARGATERVPPIALSMIEVVNPHWNPRRLPDGDTGPPSRPARGKNWSWLNASLTRADPVPLDQDLVNAPAHRVIDRPDERFRATLGARDAEATTDAPGQKFFRDAAWWAEPARNAGRDVRLVVIGHTHEARIVRGQRADGRVLVLMDCGGWVGSRWLSQGMALPVRNRQLGVRVGDDLRIYQLGAARMT